MYMNNLITNILILGQGGSIPPPGPSSTKVKYTSASGLADWEGEIVGELTSNSIPNMSYIETVDIGNTVTSIGGWAFYGCSDLTSVTIPDSVAIIGMGAFRSCSGLTSVTIPNSVTSIGSSAFYNCGGLTSVTIPDSVTSIESWTFYDCTGLTSLTIPNSVTSIGSYAFQICNSLTSLTIGNNVKNIGSNAFWGCNSLTDVIILAEGGVADGIKQKMIDAGINSNINWIYLNKVFEKEGRYGVITNIQQLGTYSMRYLGEQDSTLSIFNDIKEGMVIS